MPEDYTSAYAQMASGAPNGTCFWQPTLNNLETVIFKDPLDLTETFTLFFTAWLLLAYYHGNLIRDPTHNLVYCFMCTAGLRRGIPNMLNKMALFEEIRSYTPCFSWMPFCEVSAFFETFMAVLEVEFLTHICIERFVVAKHITNGWPITEPHYTLYKRLCFFFATLYSAVPAVGIGRYNYDFDCSSCTYDIILPNTIQKYLIVTVFSLRSVKPTMVMIGMLVRAKLLEKKYPDTEDSRRQFQLTRNAIAITCVNLACWAPIFLIRSYVVMVQIFGGPSALAGTALSATHIYTALWLHWVSPLPTVATLLLVDENIFDKMRGLRLRYILPEQPAPPTMDVK